MNMEINILVTYINAFLKFTTRKLFVLSKIWDIIAIFRFSFMYVRQRLYLIHKKQD
jgi:hypothetical protein